MYGPGMGKCLSKSKFLKLFGNVSYMSVNVDTKFKLDSYRIDKVTALNVHLLS